MAVRAMLMAHFCILVTDVWGWFLMGQDWLNGVSDSFVSLCLFVFGRLKQQGLL
jgi:hypothetical protein